VPEQPVRSIEADLPATRRVAATAPAPPSHPGRARAAAGALYIAVSALCFGSLAVFVRVALAAGADVPTMLLLRFSIAAAIMWSIFAAKRASLPRGRALAMLTAMGAVGYAGQAFSFFTAVTLASTGLAALLLYLYPTLVAVLSRLVFGHRFLPVQGLAVLLAFAGSVLTIGRAGDGTPLGIFFGLLAAVIYAAYILTGSRLPEGVTPTASTAVVTTAAAIVYAAVAAVRGVHLPATAAGWSAILALALICTVLAVAFFLAGLERIGPVRASIYSTLEPAATLVLGALVLGERVTVLRAAGGVLIIAAVVILARADAARTGAASPAS
jgi:drug/metabolite transporter (DMT)-like permease